MQPRVLQRRQDPVDQALALPCCMSLTHASTHHDEQLPQHPLWAPFGSLADPLQIPHSTTPTSPLSRPGVPCRLESITSQQHPYLVPVPPTPYPLMQVPFSQYPRAGHCPPPLALWPREGEKYRLFIFESEHLAQCGMKPCLINTCWTNGWIWLKGLW